MDCSKPGLHHLLSLLKYMSTESVILSNHLILLSSPLAFDLPSIRVFTYESALRIKWPKY